MESTGNYDDELEKQILEELENRTPWNKITQKLQVSTRRIANVKAKRSSSQTSVNDAEISAKAFQLFEMGKDPVKVTIELKQPPELILKLYDFWLGMRERVKKVNEEAYKRGYDDAMKIEHPQHPVRYAASLCASSRPTKNGGRKSGHSF